MLFSLHSSPFGFAPSASLRLSILLGLAMLTPSVAHAQGSLSRVFPNGARVGTQVTLTFEGANLPETAELVVHGGGVRPLGEFKKGVGKVEIAGDAKPGVRHLRLVGPKGATSPRPFSIGTLPELDEKEPNNRLAEAQVLDAFPVTLNGVLPSRPDIDNFRVTLKKGECLVVAGESRALGAPTNLLIRMRDAEARELLIQMDYRTRDPLLGFTAPADGDYFLEIQEVMNNYSGINQDYVYRVTVSKGPWVDYVFPPSAQRGVTSKLTFFGWNLGGKSGPSQLEVDVAVPGDAGATYPVAVPGVPYAVPVAVGNTPHSVEREPEDPALAVPVSVPGTVCGAFGKPGDVDRFQFTAKAGQVIELDVDARELVSLADPIMLLQDAAGKTLATVDDADGTRDPRLVWTAPADGNYTVVLRDVASGSRGGSGYFYRLTLEPPHTALRVTIADPTLILKPGGKLDVAVTVALPRRDDDLDLQVEGLPAGVTATMGGMGTAPAPAAGGRGRRRPSGPTVTLTLTASADAKPGYTPIRILATSSGSSAQTAVVKGSWELAKDRSGTLVNGSTEGLLLFIPAP